jgi:hypothetical protein
MVQFDAEDIRRGGKMKLFLYLMACLALTGCATNSYQIYVDAQKSISRDLTVAETARLASLTEMAKSADPAVRATGIMLLQQLQSGSKTVSIEPPKKNWLGF